MLTSQADPLTLINLVFTIVKLTFLIKHHFEFNLALEGALGHPLGSICGFWGGSWWPVWCLCGLEGAPRISKTLYVDTLEPQRLRKNIFNTKTTHFQKSRLYRRKIAVFEGEGTKIKNF